MWSWWKEFRRERQRKKLVIQLLAASAEAGLPAHDYHNAQTMLSAGEYEVAFDIIVQQLYEYELEIPVAVLGLAKQAAESMFLTPGSYFFLKELVRSADHIPVPVKEKLAVLLYSLQLSR